MAGDEDRLTGPSLPNDFADLVACLGDAGVEYMLVGGQVDADELQTRWRA